MPLARIVTSTPEQVSAAADHLRARGFEVEVVGPEHRDTGPADILIDAEGRTFQEALSLAVAASQPRTRRVIAYDLTGRPVEFASDEEEEPQPSGREGLWSRVSGALQEFGENTRLSLGHLREWVQEGRESIAEKRAQRESLRASREDTERQREEQAAQARLAAERALRERQDGEERARQQTEIARQHQEELQRERLRAEELQREEAERARQQALAEQRRREEERAHQQALAEERRRQEEERARQLALAQERRRQEERAAEEARIARQRQLDEQQQREAAERVRLANIEATREPKRAVPEVQSTMPPRPAIAAYRTPGRDRDLRKSLLAAAVIALLATLGYAAYANRRAPAPLSNRDLVRSEGISQPVPFGAATATPTQPAPPGGPRAVLPQGSAEPPAVARPTATAPKPRVKRQSTRGSDDDIAEDEVIVHRTHAPSGTPVAKGSGVKRYSDLEQ